MAALPFTDGHSCAQASSRRRSCFIPACASARGRAVGFSPLSPFCSSIGLFYIHLMVLPRYYRAFIGRHIADAAYGVVNAI